MFEVILVNDTPLQIDGDHVRWEENRVEIWTSLFDPNTKKRIELDKLMFAAPIAAILAIRKVELTNDGSV